MPTSCTFQLDRLNPIYNSGEYINGRIILKTSRMKRVNAIYITLEGEAKVQWSLSNKSEAANYYGHQQYLHTRVKVFDSIEFSAGTHVYALMLRIPPDCPSSCKGPYGYIGYSITVTIDKPWTFNEVYVKYITVVQPLNLNCNPEYSLPLKDENIKYLCQWPCSSGPISATLLLPYAGFIPMQEIPFYLEVDNQSPHYDIMCVEATLKQHFIFLARKPFKRNFFSQTLSKRIIEERTLRLTKRLYKSTVYVPEHTQRSTLNPNYIVFLHYTIQVRLKTGYFHYDMDISVPVVIGTVPLRQVRNLVTTQPTSMSRQIAQLSEIDEQSEGRQENNDDDNGNDDDDDVDDDDDDDDDDDNGNGNAKKDRTIKMKKDDDPPSYDSCLPPSFSFATLSSQQTLDFSGSLQEARQRIYVDLPKFPAYKTFATSTQAISASTDSALNMHYYNSYGSLQTDHTGRSLDTFGSIIGILNENEEDEEQEEQEEQEHDV